MKNKKNKKDLIIVEEQNISSFKKDEITPEVEGFLNLLGAYKKSKLLDE